MPSYITMTTAGRTRILRVTATGAVPVTALTDPDQGAALAAALTCVGTDLPAAVAEVLAATGVTLPDPCVWEYSSDIAVGDWLGEPAPTQVLDVTRRTLAALSSPTPPFGLLALARVLAGLPEPVARAVRDEVGMVMADYDDVPVMAHVYDRKWNDANWSVLVTGALNRVPRKTLERVVGGNGGELLDFLETNHDAVIPAEVTAAAEQGYLRVDLHPAQLDAWLARNHPDLATAAR